MDPPVFKKAKSLLIMIDSDYFSLGVLDSLSYKNTCIHRLDPRTKVLSALAFVITVASFPKYEISGLFPLFVFPTLVFTFARIPFRLIAKKILVVSVFAIFIGLFNPLLDREIVMHVGGIPVSAGWISFSSILLKYVLTMSAGLLLIATTSFPGICLALQKLGVPEIFISQLLFLYRYIFVLLEETLRMVRARELRSFTRRGLEIRIFIPLIGTLFIRAIERAERIYQAMLSRGFDGAFRWVRGGHLRRADFFCLSASVAALLLFRCYDVVGFLGRQTLRIF